ncbi:MAG: hypothetical protein Q8R97_07495 [Brevundimonas sp.]|uniref:hypothetical protein n=1 Tax=Brevundimonas sp. TaxID=1871086 RepID=UPI002771876C|nr:hypothetical protein [Brevundimonas sp.]MDP3400949.1 hypothetical protein [Brevundimonas sp.]MDZ4108107.1 hypothetical protein [Brevundimonas sp.]
MSQHNIVGSEVGARRPIAYLSRLPERRRPRHPVAWLFAGVAVAGIGLGLVDSLLIGRPVTIFVAIAVLVIWRLWPERRA